MIRWTAAFLIMIASGLKAEPPAGVASTPTGTSLINELSASVHVDLPLRPEAIARIREQLWQKYRAIQMADPVRIEENRTGQLHFGSIMRYSCRKAGDKPATGYPLFIALHGGGSAPSELNDGAWKSMSTWYLDSIKQGLYVAPRGIADAWNLHSLPDAFPMYDRLIENMILFEDADPNRVYILGYSAGGDGVYQISPRMADRLAAANMSAGHHNGVGPVNLYNLPFLIQMGEQDVSYSRHKDAVNFSLALDKLQKEYGGYVHDCFLHLGKGHGIAERDQAGTPQDVIANLTAWREKGDRVTKPVNANAITWVGRHVRNPWPPRVIWDPGTRADRSGVRSTGEKLWPTPNRDKLFYWLDISGAGKATLADDRIDVRVDKTANAISIEKTTSWLRLLLNGNMLDLSKPVIVTLDGKTFSVMAHPNLKTMSRTLIDRGDPNYCFEAEITVEKNGDTWSVTGS
ncbi:MAG: hypothetical protein WCN95_14115 [bacterium]